MQFNNRQKKIKLTVNMGSKYQQAGNKARKQLNEMKK